MTEKLIHEILPVGWLQCNCSVVGDPETREAIVIDPGDEVERVLGVITKHGLTVKAILNTHAHIDHVGGLRGIQQATGAPVLMHAEDLELYRHLDVQASWIGMRPPEMVNVDGFLKDGDAVRWGRYEGRVIHTAGHTPGSLCIYMPGVTGTANPAGPGSVLAGTGPGRLFAGDTLFAGSIGRTDLWGGSFEEIMRSLHTKVMALPDETLVYPGHGPSTTVGKERKTNPFLHHS